MNAFSILHFELFSILQLLLLFTLAGKEESLLCCKRTNHGFT